LPERLFLAVRIRERDAEQRLAPRSVRIETSVAAEIPPGGQRHQACKRQRDPADLEFSPNIADAL
jgi:hypothetical protein